MNRYTSLLKDKDIKNIIYAYGEKDEAVGRLTDREVNFLNEKGATVYKVEDGSHGSMFDLPHKVSLRNLLLK